MKLSGGQCKRLKISLFIVIKRIQQFFKLSSSKLVIKSTLSVLDTWEQNMRFIRMWIVCPLKNLFLLSLSVSSSFNIWIWLLNYYVIYYTSYKLQPKHLTWSNFSFHTFHPFFFLIFWIRCHHFQRTSKK